MAMRESLSENGANLEKVEEKDRQKRSGTGDLFEPLSIHSESQI